MALRDQPYLPLYVQDFITCEKLSECSASATGVYIRLLCLFHKSEEYGCFLLKQKHKQTPEPLKNFALSLARFMPWPEETVYRALVELVEEKVLTVEGDLLSQSRMRKDFKTSEARSKAGATGGKVTQAKRGDFAQPFAKAKNEAKKEQNTENESVIENENISKEKGKKESEALTAEPWPTFSDFWEAYQYKADRKDAERAWLKVKQSDREKIMQALPGYVSSTFTNGAFPSRKLAATYLNKQSWNNETNPTNQGGPKLSGPYNIQAREVAAITELANRRPDRFNTPGDFNQ